MKLSKAEVQKFRDIIAAHGFSPLNKGLNAYARNPEASDFVKEMIDIFPEYKGSSREMAMLLFDGQRNGNSPSTNVIRALYFVQRNCANIQTKNFRLKLDNVPYNKSMYKKVPMFYRSGFEDALVIIKSRLSVISPKTVEKYRKVMAAIDAAR